MALNGKYISIQEIMWELYRDTDMKEEISYSDAIEWTVDVLNLIGYPDQYINKVTGYEEIPEWDFVNYRIELPCDFHRLVQLSVDGYPAIYSGNTFQNLLDGGCCGIDQLGTSDGDTFTDIFGNEFNTALGPNTSSAPVSFTINNNFVTFSTKSGKVCMSYLAFPTDDNGFPLIPDNTSYKEAVKRFIMYKIDYRKWRQQPNSQALHSLYLDSQREYEWYVAQAGSKAKLPDLSRMESLKNQMLRLKPRTTLYDDFFRQQSVPEYKKIK